MIDPIAIITLSASIIAKCYDYGCKVADAPAEAQELLIAVSNLSAVLVSIQGLWSQNSAELDRLRLPHALEACESSLIRVEARLESHIDKVGRSKKERLLGRLIWPLKRSETLEIVQLMEQQKSTLGLILENFTLQKTIESQHELGEISESIKRLNTTVLSVESDKKGLEILDWICSYQHQTPHDNARQTHCEDTSSWIIDDPTFKLWRKSRGQLLWLSGLPGSGKTILTSHVIEHLLEASGSDSSSVVYFYFDRSTNQTLAVHNFLGSILRQLCAQHGLSQRIKDLFTSSQRPAGGVKDPDLTKLRTMFKERAAAADAIYIVVDGVDEASDPIAVCEMLEWILQSKSTIVSCFMSSRPLSTTSHLQIGFKLAASLENVSNDISTYIRSRLSSESRLKKMKPELRKFVEQRLLLKAYGMFRLVQCQLDEISKLRTDGAIKAALNTLPKTLEASYSRMLDRIDTDDLIYARRVLLWLAHAFYPLHLLAIAEAAVFELRMSQIEDEVRLSDPNDILDICGLFISHNDMMDEVRLAHHTVREFLLSAENSSIHLPKKQSHRELAELCLSYLLMSPFAGPVESPEKLFLTFRRYPLLEYAARCWTMHVEEAGCEEELQPLILRLMTPKPSQKFFLWLQIVLWHSTHGFERPSAASVKHPTPLYYASSYGLYHTVKSLIEAGADLNIQAGQYGGTAYHAACWRQHPHVARLLLQAGIDADIRDNNGMTAFDIIEFSGFDDVAAVALEFNRGITRNYVIQKKLEQALKASYLHQQQQRREGRGFINTYVGASQIGKSPSHHSAQKEASDTDTTYELE